MSQLTKKLRVDIDIAWITKTYLNSFDCVLNLVDTSLRGECVDTTIVVLLTIELE